MRDMLGREFKVGDYVAKAMYGTDLRVRKVTKLVGGHIWLDRATNAVMYPQCLLIVSDVENIEKRSAIYG